jgi:hypothetical protein
VETDPDRTAWRILELRAYAQTKAAIDRAKKPEDVPHGPMATLVREIDMQLWRERRARRGQ